MPEDITQIGPQPGMQMRFLQSDETEVFYGGEAGGGKSFALGLDAMRFVDIIGYRAVIFRRVFDDLEDLIGEMREIYCPKGARYNSSKHDFVWPNTSKIMFRHMQHMKDIYHHQGRAYDFIGFDELPQFPKLAYTYLFSRLRGKNPNIRRYMRSTGNPDGEGLLWVKNRFIDPLTPLVRGYFKTILGKDTKCTKDTPGVISRKFIPCIRKENRALMDNDPGYEDRLDQLPEEQKRALKFGLWTLKDKPDQLILVEWWENAVNGENEFVDDGKYTIGADFGTYDGVDLSVEFLGIGNRPYRCRSWPKTKAPIFSLILATTAKSVEFAQCRIGVDSIGPGVGVADDLEIHQKCGHILERCAHKDPIYDEKHIGTITFDNLRSQMCWYFRECMEKGEIDLRLFQHDVGATKDGKIFAKAYFEDFNLLVEEVLAHTFRVYNGKLIVIPKEELRKADNLGRSPDYFDALVIWNWTRRTHYVIHDNIDDEYKIDEYAEEFFQDEFDEDSAIYHGDSDEGDYMEEE